jgi:hypothetical protein
MLRCEFSWIDKCTPLAYLDNPQALIEFSRIVS